jgi:hypothetical protein
MVVVRKVALVALVTVVHSSRDKTREKVHDIRPLSLHIPDT